MAVAIVLTAIWRPLLFASVDPDVAQARGVPHRAARYRLPLRARRHGDRGGPDRGHAAGAQPGHHAGGGGPAPERQPLRGHAALRSPWRCAAADGGLLLSFQFPTVKPSVLIVALSFAFYVVARLVGPAVTSRRRNRSAAPGPGRVEPWLSTPTTRPVRSRRTRQGDAVLNVVLGSDNFRSAQDIHAELRASGETVGLTTVYRHLALLTDEGRLDALQTADGELVYRRCHSESHHHHVVCRTCGRGTEVELPDLERWAESTASDLGYSDVTHTVEIFGVCADCRG